MKTVTPDYYPRFRCIASACRHSCCTGWDVMVNEEALARWRTAAPELLSAVADSEDGPCFRMRGDGRCPFLRDDGLCSMIAKYGEDILCDICADHPRFRNWFSGRVETGLGLCCEAAAKVVLENTEPLGFIVTDDGEDGEPLTEGEQELLEFRSDIFDILGDRSLSFPRRLDRVFEAAETELPEQTDAQLARLLSGLEIMSGEWRECIARLETGAGPQRFVWSTEWDLRFEQLALYLFYRHLPEALDDGDIEGKVLFSAFFIRLTERLLARDPRPAADRFEELCRLASAELEYSDENPARIVEALTRR